MTTIGSENLTNGPGKPERFGGKYRGARRDTVLTEVVGDCWYIHDLSVAPHARGRGLTRRLLAACLEAHPEITRSELVAVPGAEPVWSRLGWSGVNEIPASLAAKVAGYGTGSVYMARDWR